MTVYKTANISWSKIEDDCALLAQKIQKSGRSFQKILGVTRGGLVPTTLLAWHLNIRTIECVALESYQFDQQSGVKELKPALSEFLVDALIVDDLVDKGSTLDFLRKKSSNCAFAVLYAKPSGQNSTDFFIEAFPQDVWIKLPWELEG